MIIIFYFCSFGGGYVKFLYRDHIDAVDFQKGPQQFFKFLAGLQVGKGWIGTLPGCCWTLDACEIGNYEIPNGKGSSFRVQWTNAAANLFKVQKHPGCFRQDQQLRCWDRTLRAGLDFGDPWIQVQASARHCDAASTAERAERGGRGWFGAAPRSIARASWISARDLWVWRRLGRGVGVVMLKVDCRTYKKSSYVKSDWVISQLESDGCAVLAGWWRRRFDHARCSDCQEPMQEPFGKVLGDWGFQFHKKLWALLLAGHPEKWLHNFRCKSVKFGDLQSPMAQKHCKGWQLLANHWGRVVPIWVEDFSHALL